jgi:beta-glucanase (GH16 family)
MKENVIRAQTSGKKNATFIFAFIVLLAMIAGCKKKDNVAAPERPVLTTSAITGITTSAAVSGGNISAGTNVTERGVVWSLTSGPTVSNNAGKTSDGTGTGSFTSNLSSLSAGTVYYVRAYASNSLGTEYGNEISFRTAEEPPVVPAAANAAGYTKLTFDDEFNSINTIDTAATKKTGFNWYTDGAFGGGNAKRSAYDVSNGVLRISNSGSYTGNWVISSVSPQGDVGHSFKYAYFEARIKFDPTLGKNGRGFPAWWGFSRHHTVAGDPSHWAELDFFEAYTGGFADYSGAFVGTIHDWADDSRIHFQNANNFISNPGVDYNQFHTYGCLWKPGEITWYFDGKAMMTQKYSATAPPVPFANSPITSTQEGVFSIIDNDPQFLILGSDTNWPMYVDWVRVWQQ